MIPIFIEKGIDHYIEVVIDESADGETVALQQTELREWFKHEYECYCVYYRGPLKHYCMKKIAEKTD